MSEIINGLRIEKGTVLRYVGKAEEVVLPSDVLRIAPFAFAGCKTLKRIVTPYNLLSIGKGAFYGCDDLAEVTLPGRLYKRAKGGKAFPENANVFFRFYASTETPLEDEDYSDYFDTLDAYLCSGIKDEDMFDAVGRFGGYIVINNAPAPTYPTAAPLPADVGQQPQSEVCAEEVAKPLSKAEKTPNAEEQTEEVEAVEMEDEEAENEPHEDITLDGDDYAETLQEKMEAVIPTDNINPQAVAHKNLINDNDYLIEDDKVIKYIGSATETTVPEYVRIIGENAFANTEVLSVTLPEELHTIGKNAFAWCSKLSHVAFPSGVKIIDDGAFASCQGLTELLLPQSLEYIGADAFRACSEVKTLTLPQSIKSIGRRAFDFCASLESVEVPCGITVLTEGVFSHCESLHKVVLPVGLIRISDWAFADCYGLREVNFPSGLTDIGDVAFLNCRSLVAFDLPSSLRRIGRQAFVGCASLHLVTMPRRLEKQLKPQKAFYKLPSLQTAFFDDETMPSGE